MTEIRYCTGDNVNARIDGPPGRKEESHHTTRMHRSLSGTSFLCPICRRVYVKYAGFVGTEEGWW